MTHFQTLLAFALCVSVAMGFLSKEGSPARLKAAAWTFVRFVAASIAIGWLLYPFSH
jgi:hypothetical protein